MNRDLSKGSVVKSMLLFAIPMILGDLLQQCYNIADTLIVGQFLGEKALAAVGSSFTLMTFITSIILGLCMGSGALFSIRFGQRDENGLKEDICASFFFITAVTILLNIIAYISLSGLRNFLRVPDEVWGDMKEYLFVIFMGIPAVYISAIFCVVVSAFVYIFAKPLMMIFVDAKETAIIMEGVRYLRIEGAFYIGIGWLFLLYGLYRALGRPGMSVVLTVFSLGTRVALAYILSAVQAIGVVGIWWSIPIGWALADIVGLLYYKIKKQNLVEKEPEM